MQENYDKMAIILVANKTDMVRSRKVSTKDIREIAMRHKVKYAETSSGNLILII